MLKTVYDLHTWTKYLRANNRSRVSEDALNMVLEMNGTNIFLVSSAIELLPSCGK
jgi:DNA polymerase III delta subunit